MNGEAVSELALRLAKPQQMGNLIVAPDDWKLHDPAGVVAAAPKAAAFAVATLAALVEYVTTNRDGLDVSKLIVHVETPNRVSVGGPLRERSRDREMYLTAQAQDMTDGFIGKWLSIEDFIIGLQVRFVDEADRAKLLEFVSNVRTEQSTDAKDDGVSQELIARNKALAAHVPVPNPVQLRPYRTFRNIPQPLSPYVLRATAQPGQLPQFTLLEADGGTWKLDTINEIRNYLVAELGTTVAVLA